MYILPEVKNGNLVSDDHTGDILNEMFYTETNRICVNRI